MKRVTILGSSGSGKSMFARRLGEILDIKVYHLDLYYWQPNWGHPDPEAFKRVNQEIISGDRWIVEGNYSATRPMRLKASDTIIYLDEAPWRCAARFVKRSWLQASRPDLPEGCREYLLSPDLLDHLRHVLAYRKTRYPKIMEEIRQFAGEKEIHELRGLDGAESFLSDLEAEGVPRSG